MKKDIKITVCEAPICVGSPTTGTEEAYSFLSTHGLSNALGDKAVFSSFKPERTKPDILKDPNLKNLETVVHVCSELLRMQRIAFENNTMPITVGGDHSIVMSSVSALSEKVGTDNTVVVYIDGHADINTEKTSFSGRIHGMPLAQVLGLCTEKLDIGCKNKPALQGKNLYIIGAHSIDEPEYEIIEKQNVTLYSPKEVSDLGVDHIADEILSASEGKHIHLSFDVDSIDGSEFTSTGYVMSGGLSFKTVFSLLQRFILSGKIASFDCVEYNPSLDKNFSDMNKLLDIFKLFSKI